ncbi:kinase-like protein [Canariomyces notabilis]|uniref:non-specific serine/threonine protein kinase n=1 Tax=Canariomyces notabilis TaxID=2074819 RepID=A0AAN6YU35_9PEZI|nr:kinase-like protein [Canariomyces arenarius]
MVGDSDLIARIYPEVSCVLAWDTIESHPLKAPPRFRLPPSESTPGRNSRESTASLDDDQTADKLDSLPCIELRFSNLPRTPRGLVFGKDSDSDVLLPSLSGISRHHFALTYKNTFSDGLYRLIVRDLGSMHGTAVTYDKQGKEKRVRFDWIIAGFELPNKADAITVQPLPILRFRIVVADHDITSAAYIAKVERFLHGSTGVGSLFGNPLRRSGQETDCNTGELTPSDGPILLLQKVIAQGSFGTVSRYWDVSSGEEYARKEPVGREYDEKLWQEEIDIMRKVPPHENIVRLCFWTKAPRPLLYLEYMPFGNLENAHKSNPFSRAECLTILSQSLAALVYLHGQPKPIAHRDIKPHNILVKNRDAHHNPEHLHVKLSDFGLSKAGTLRTFCGTDTYLAPEIHMERPRHKYTEAVDIWSLGVVILRLTYGLPRPGHGSGIEWCEKIVKRVKSLKSDDLVDLLQKMLVIDPTARDSAVACLPESLRLYASFRDRSLSPTQASFAASSHTHEDRIGVVAHSLSSDPEWVGLSLDSNRSGALFRSQEFHERDASPPNPPQQRMTEIARPSSQFQPLQDVSLLGSRWLQDPGCFGSSIDSRKRKRDHLSNEAGRKRRRSQRKAKQRIKKKGKREKGDDTSS